MANLWFQFPLDNYFEIFICLQSFCNRIMFMCLLLTECISCNNFCSNSFMWQRLVLYVRPSVTKGYTHNSSYIGGIVKGNSLKTLHVSNTFAYYHMENRPSLRHLDQTVFERSYCLISMGIFHQKPLIFH